jgi:recombination protein RecT
MTTDIATQAPQRAPKPIEKFCSLIDAKQPTFAAALPPHISFDRFRSVVISALSLEPKLLKADQSSLFTSCLQAASDGLLPNKREAALVVFSTKENGEFISKVQYMPMVAGILKKMRQSGEVSAFTAQCVYEHDDFDFSHGTESFLRHKPLIKGDRGELICVYAFASLKDGSHAFEVMTLEQVDRRRDVSKSYKGKSGPSGPWHDWYDEMALKTVARKLMKMLPSNSDIDRLMNHMDQDTDLTPQRRAPAGLTDEPDVVFDPPAMAEGEVME